jgi:hypothetical protein
LGRLWTTVSGFDSLPPSQFASNLLNSFMFSSILAVEMMAGRKRVTSRVTFSRKSAEKHRAVLTVSPENVTHLKRSEMTVLR